MKFKKNIVMANLLLGAMFTESVYAKIKSERSSAQAGGGEASGTVKVTESKPLDERVELKTGTAGTSCGMDINKQNYFPLDFFKDITRDGSLPTFKVEPGYKVSVNVPAILDGCGKFKPVVHQDETTKNVTVMMTLEKDGNKWNYGQFIKCLEDKKILKDDKIIHTNLEGKNYSQYGYTIDYAFDKKIDIKKSVKLSFGTPVAFQEPDEYPTSNGLDESVALPSNLCIKAEKLGPQITYLNKGRDVLIEELNAICKSGDAQKIAEAKWALGNAEALHDIADKVKAELEGGYLIAVKANVEEIGKEMSKIEEKLAKNRDTLDESTAKKDIAKYTELSKKLDSIYLNPAVGRLDKLMATRDDLKDPSDELTKVDDEIKELNKGIRAMADRPTGVVDEVMEKFALNESARTIEDIRLKSHLYSKVYPGPADKRGAPLTFEAANKKQIASMERFEKILMDRTDVYLASQGNTAPLRKTKREADIAMKRMNSLWSNYEKKEYSDYKRYCATSMLGSMKNPVQCKSFYAGVQSRRNRALQKRERDLYFIKGRYDKMSKLESGYGEYQQRRLASADDEGEYDSYGSSFSDYEDSFSDRYGGSFAAGGRASGGYDPMMYNMMGGQQQMFGMQQQNPMMYGGQNQMMYGGQNPMMYGGQNPMMFGGPNPMMFGGQNPMMFGGQQQMMSGGWPSI